MNQIPERIVAGQGTPADLATYAHPAVGIQGNTVCALGDAGRDAGREPSSRSSAEFEHYVSTAPVARDGWKPDGMNIVIDDREIDADDGETVLAGRSFATASRSRHFCYHAKLTVAGSRRMPREGELDRRSCSRRATSWSSTAKMKVETRSTQVLGGARNALQFIREQIHPVDFRGISATERRRGCRLQ